MTMFEAQTCPRQKLSLQGHEVEMKNAWVWEIVIEFHVITSSMMLHSVKNNFCIHRFSFFRERN